MIVTTFFTSVISTLIKSIHALANPFTNKEVQDAPPLARKGLGGAEFAPLLCCPQPV